MGSYPFGPHGPQTRPYDPVPNPTPSTPPMQIGGGAWSPAQSYGGGSVAAPGGDGRGFFADIIFSFVLVVVLLWMPFACLYPLTVLSGLLSGFFAAGLLGGKLGWDGQTAAGTGILIGAVVIWTLIRVEYRMSQVALYRVVRHVARMLLLSLLAVPMILMAQGAGQWMSEFRFVVYTLSSRVVLQQFFRNPVDLGIWAAVMVGLHFLIWNSTRARNFWHRRLKMIGMK